MAPAASCRVVASAYERELKGVLGGDDTVVRKLTRATRPDVTACYLRARDRPFLVVRGAGSLGVDLVALRGDVSFPIEVKSAANDVIRFTDSGSRNQDQAEAMMRECSRSSVIPLYAYRIKNKRGEDPWRIFTLPTENLPPRINVLYNRLPKIERTPAGNFAMRWNDGMPLHAFIDYLSR